MKKLDSKLFSENKLTERHEGSIVGGAYSTDPCCDTEQATTVRDETESCADTVNNGTDFWADVKFVFP